MTLYLTRRGALGGIAAFTLSAGAHTPSFALSSSPLSLEEVVQRHTLARGGAEALDRVRSILMASEMTDGPDAFNGRYAADAAGLVRIDVYAAGNFVGAEGVDRQGVWLRGANSQPRDSVATGAANALLHGAEAHLFGLHRFPERGHRVRLMPGTRLDGIDYQVVEVVFSTGHTSYFYVDPSTWLITRRRDERAFHPDVSSSQQRIETRYSDFQTVEGVVAPHRDTNLDLATGNVLGTVQVSRRVINPVLPEGLFDRSYQPPRQFEAGSGG